MLWDKPQRRCFQRLKTGFHWHKGEILRFLTLNTIPDMKKGISECYSDLYKRIRRLTPMKLYQDGYVSKSQLRNQYAGTSLNENLSFDYIKIRTSEGPSGVLHILYFGDFLPQRWLKENWHAITGGSNSAFIKMCRRPVYNEKRLAGYCIEQYCISQNKDVGCSAFEGYSWSRDWAYKGFSKDWEVQKALVGTDNREMLFESWNDWLDRCKRGPPPWLQLPLEVEYT